LIPVTLFFDIGNIIFFIANLPQIITAYKNRKNLVGLSTNYLLILSIGTVLFGIGNYAVGAYIASAFCALSLIIYGIQIYWKKHFGVKGKFHYSLDEAGWHIVYD
jgi:uncharacterized protein with PQ loop repeat